MENAGEIHLPVCTKTPRCRQPFPVGTTTCPYCGQATEERPLSALKHMIPAEYYHIMESLVQRSSPTVSETSSPISAL